MTPKNDGAVPPRGRDKMSGRYWLFGWQPPVTKNGRQIWPARWRRRVEERAVRRYAETAAKEEAAAVDADNDPSDCRHGCNGDCVASEHGSDRCDFTCHPHLMACPRCGRVMERQEFHDHENRDCGFMWYCLHCGFENSGVFVGCAGD